MDLIATLGSFLRFALWCLPPTARIRFGAPGRATFLSTAFLRSKITASSMSDRKRFSSGVSPGCSSWILLFSRPREQVSSMRGILLKSMGWRREACCSGEGSTARAPGLDHAVDM